MHFQRTVLQWDLTALPLISQNYSHFIPAGYVVNLHTNNKTVMQTLKYTKQDQCNFGQLYSFRIKSLFMSTFLSPTNKKPSKNLYWLYWLTTKIMTVLRWTQRLSWQNTVSSSPTWQGPTDFVLSWLVLPVCREEVTPLPVPGEGVDGSPTLAGSRNQQDCGQGGRTQSAKEARRVNNVCKTAEGKFCHKCLGIMEDF